MPAFSNPCSDFLTPFLDEYGRCKACGSWEAACRLAVISVFWNYAVTEWRALETRIVLDSRANVSALHAIAISCTKLQKLTLAKCAIPEGVFGPILTLIARASPCVIDLALPHADTLCLLNVFKHDWTMLWSLQTLNLSYATYITDYDLTIFITRLKNLKNIIMEGVVFQGIATLSLLIEQQAPKLQILKLSDATFQSESLDSTLQQFDTSLAKCSAVREICLRGIPFYFSLSCTQIAVLDLSDTHIGSLTLDVLVKMTMLKRLCIRGTPLALALALAMSMRQKENAWPFYVWPEFCECVDKAERGWGVLDFQRERPNDAGVKWLGPTNDDRLSIPVKGFEYTVGRSRRNLLQIGDNWCGFFFVRCAHNLMCMCVCGRDCLFVSGEHMLLYYWFVWTSGQISIEPWVWDKSQNGTFLNGLPVGYRQHAPLSHGDRLEVFGDAFFRKRNDVDPPTCRFKLLATNETD